MSVLRDHKSIYLTPYCTIYKIINTLNPGAITSVIETLKR